MFFNFSKKNFFFSLVALALGYTIYYRNQENKKQIEQIKKWSDENKISLSKKKIKLSEFKIEFDQKEWDLLKEKLETTRYFDSLKDAKSFEFGFNPDFAKQLVNYWKKEFDWKSKIDYLNKFPHYKILIDDITIHYLRVITNPNRDKKPIPLMLIDGWPGSFFGFYKFIDYINDNFKDMSFDITVASIPGYFYSTPLKVKFDCIDTARYFDYLMRFLHGENVEYFIHGEDWGSIITTNMAQIYPERVKGIHLTMPLFSDDLISTFHLLKNSIFPSFFLSNEELKANFSIKASYSNFFKIILKDTGYMHLQATKPDSLAHGLTDSPVGLLAYILEKYSSWSFDLKSEIIGFKDGGLSRFDRDDLLTVITLYWMTNSIHSSVRYYKNNFDTIGERGIKYQILSSAVSCNTAIHYSKNELAVHFLDSLKQKYLNIKSYTFSDEGGHFAAFHIPKASASNFVRFIKSCL